jgi:hypothetical protein
MAALEGQVEQQWKNVTPTNVSLRHISSSYETRADGELTGKQGSKASSECWVPES